MNRTKYFFSNIGSVFMLLGMAVVQFPKIFKSFNLLTQQLFAIGYTSLPLIVLTSAFTGMVASIQTAYQIKEYVSLELLSVGISKMIFIELGPMLAALVLSGRVGASIAAEIGTMRVTEQIDGLESLSIDPVKYLFLPRLLAGMIMVPILVIFTDFIAIISAMLISTLSIGVSLHSFLEGLRWFFEIKDLLGGLVKAVFFGIIITTMGYHFGAKAKGGAEGVGIATTKAVVAASVLILMADYFVGSFIFR